MLSVKLPFDSKEWNADFVLKFTFEEANSSFTISNLYIVKYQPTQILFLCSVIIMHESNSRRGSNFASKENE